MSGVGPRGRAAGTRSDERLANNMEIGSVAVVPATMPPNLPPNLSPPLRPVPILPGMRDELHPLTRHGPSPFEVVALVYWPVLIWSLWRVIGRLRYLLDTHADGRVALWFDAKGRILMDVHLPPEEDGLYVDNGPWRAGLDPVAHFLTPTSPHFTAEEWGLVLSAKLNPMHMVEGALEVFVKGARRCSWAFAQGGCACALLVGVHHRAICLRLSHTSTAQAQGSAG